MATITKRMVRGKVVWGVRVRCTCTLQRTTYLIGHVRTAHRCQALGFLWGPISRNL